MRSCCGTRCSRWGAFAATLALTVYLYVIVPKGFFPQQDVGRLSGNIRADQSTSYQAMDGLLKRFVKVVGEDPAVDNVIAFCGGSGANQGRMFVALKPIAERKVSADAVIGRLRGKLASIPGATLFLQAVQDLRIGGRASNAQYQFALQGDDLAELNDWSPRVLEALRKIDGLVDVSSDQQNGGLQALLDYDRATAKRLGLATADIDATLYDAFGQRPVSTMYRQLNQYHVIMEAAPQYWQTPDGGLSQIYVRGAAGKLIPLAAIATDSRGTTALQVNHQSQFPATTISFNLRPDVSLGTAVTRIEQATRDMGLPQSIQGTFSGAAQAFQDSLSSQPLLVAAALVTVYVVLGVLYESVVHPLTILSTLPSAGVGALLALLIFKVDLSVIALIGIILLIGIVKKNAIMMIDFALEAERGEGLTARDAIFKACVLRFRPIIMTTLAALLGGLPLAFGAGTGAELRQPLGVAIVGGLIFSQVLTLYTTPVIYLYLDRLRTSGRRPAAVSAVDHAVIRAVPSSS